MDYIRRSIFRQQGDSLGDVNPDVEWQPQQLYHQSSSQPAMVERDTSNSNNRFTFTRRPFSSLFTRNHNEDNNNNNNTGASNNKYALASNFGESTENLASGAADELASPRSRFSLGIPSLQLPRIGLVGHSRFSEQSSAPRPLFTQRNVAAGPRAPSSVYPPTEYPTDNLNSGIPPLPTEPMPTYTYTGPHSGVTTTQIEAGGHGRSGDIEDARTRRHHDRHGKTRATRKHSGKTRSGANNKHGKSKRRHQQSSRHHDVSGSAANGATTTESSLSSSTNSSGESNEKRGRDREHRRRARSPPRPFMGCFPPVRSRRMRARIVQCVVAGLFLVLIVGIFAGLALTNTVDPSQLTIPMAVIVGISALILIYLIARLVMLIKHKRNKAKLRAQRRNDLEAQHQKQQQQQSAYAPHIALPSDREVPGLDAGIARVEPPAYGHWRESMRASPNRAYWQHSEPSPISEKSQRSPQEADYANHPAVIGSSSAPPANAEPASYLTMRHDNEVVYDNSAVSDLGSSALSSFSPSPSAVSSPSVVHATRAFVHQDALPTTVPTTPWPRPPSYISDNGNTPRARNNNHANTNTNNTTTSPSSFLAPPNPPPTLMQLPSDFSLFDPSASRVHDQTQHLYHHQQQQEEDDDDDNAQDILPATKFQPAYYIPDPRDTQAYQARQQQDYSIDRAASEAAMSRAQSPVHQHHQHQYHQYGTAASSALGVGARSDCGTIEVGITQSQYFGGGAGVGYGGLGSYCGSRVGGVDERDEIVYDDFHHNQGVGEEEEVAYLDVEVYSDDEVVHGGKEGGLDAEEEEENSKRKSRSNRDRRRKERRGQGKVDGTPLIGQLGGVNGWS